MLISINIICVWFWHQNSENLDTHLNEKMTVKLICPMLPKGGSIKNFIIKKSFPRYAHTINSVMYNKLTWIIILSFHPSQIKYGITVSSPIYNNFYQDCTILNSHWPNVMTRSNKVLMGCRVTMCYLTNSHSIFFLYVNQFLYYVC